MGEIWTIDGKVSQISTTYQPLINCHNVRQVTSIEPAKESASQEASPPRHIDFMSSMTKTTVGASSAIKKVEEEEKLLPPLKHSRSKSCPKHPRKPKERIPEKIEIGGKRTKLLFKFVHYPEYLELGATFVIADPKIRVFGEVTKIFYDV